ncbi:MAG TPA: rod shape-determining protein RodA [Bacteroidales bacterium]|nr:rod shape-determining protein RodA [Bacteroidales bacterium]HPT22222.1 rod shape-determining protein RodA [Bacteroidales bacterium]
MKSSNSIWKGVDKTSILLFLVLIIMGWFNIYSAVYNEEHKDILDFSQRYGKQFIWIIASLIIAVFTLTVDNRFYFFFSWFVYGFTILLLFLVLIFGKEINGARSWFEFGWVSLQPSEFAKIGTALALASYLNTKNQDLTRISVMIPALAIILLPAILTALQPDMGSTIVYFALFIVLYREGMSTYIFVSGILMIILFFLTLLLNNLYLTIGLIIVAFFLVFFTTRKMKLCLTGAGIFIVITAILFTIKYFVLDITVDSEMILLISIILSGVVFAYYFYTRRATAILVIFLFLTGSILFINTVDYTFNNIIQPHQKERIEITLGIKSDPHGTGYNVNQSIISVGSGGFKGKGYLQGTQTKFKFVPSQSTDFIFCTVGEEWGFLGSIVLIGLYLFLLLRLVILAERQRSVFTRVYGYGVLSIFFVHIFINIGMAIGLVPVIGIPLPFLSYGGSSLWAFTILLFIFLRLDASRTEYMA